MAPKSDEERAYLEEVFGISKPKQTSDVEPKPSTTATVLWSGGKVQPAISDKSGSSITTTEPTTTTEQTTTTEPTTSTEPTTTSKPTTTTEPTTSTAATHDCNEPQSMTASAPTIPSSSQVQVQEAIPPDSTPSPVSIPPSEGAEISSPTSSPPLTTPGSGHYSPPLSTANKSHVDILLTMKDSWMLRHCDSYREELKSCKSLRGRFHQFYVHGKALDCSDWEASFDDCKAWNSKADEAAARRIIEREKGRIGSRLKDHYGNDVWEKRQAPPPEWEKPLPEWLKDKNENSYFSVYMAEKNKEANATVTEANLMYYSAKASSVLPSCSIM